jgi:hypothetical protein
MYGTVSEFPGGHREQAHLIGLVCLLRGSSLECLLSRDSLRSPDGNLFNTRPTLRSSSELDLVMRTIQIRLVEHFGSTCVANAMLGDHVMTCWEWKYVSSFTSKVLSLRTQHIQDSVIRYELNPIPCSQTHVIRISTSDEKERCVSKHRGSTMHQKCLTTDSTNIPKRRVHPSNISLRSDRFSPDHFHLLHLLPEIFGSGVWIARFRTCNV